MMRLWDHNWTRLREFIIWGVVAIVIGAIVAAVVYVLAPQLSAQAPLRLGDGVFATELESPDIAWGRLPQLAADEARIVVYPHDEAWKVRFSRLRYPVDLVWLDSHKKVVYIVKNVTPEVAIDGVYIPKSAARYIVELAGGTVDHKRIMIGDTAVFEEEKVVQK